jgi:hypothetical protein
MNASSFFILLSFFLLKDLNGAYLVLKAYSKMVVKGQNENDQVKMTYLQTLEQNKLEILKID